MCRGVIPDLEMTIPQVFGVWKTLLWGLMAPWAQRQMWRQQVKDQQGPKVWESCQVAQSLVDEFFGEGVPGADVYLFDVQMFSVCWYGHRNV